MKITRSGRFGVSRNATGSIDLTHVPTGLAFGGFSHLRIRTLRAAIEGVERVEQRISGRTWDYIDGGPQSGLAKGNPRTHRECAVLLRDYMREEFWFAWG